jgi:hypothetical protein
VPREAPPTWHCVNKPNLHPAKITTTLTRMTALVAPARPFDFSRWGICSDMVDVVAGR